MTLSFEQVDFSYGSRRVLGGVSCALTPGTVTAILGPNGAGKSTLIRLGIGALTPDRGAVLLEGEPVGSIPPRRRAARIASIAQHPSIAFAFSVGQTVAMGRYHAGDRAERKSAVAGALDRLGLLDRADEPLTHLSAGQVQRVALARAMVQLGSGPTPHARVLLADEPISAQDPGHQLTIEGVLGELGELGVAVGVVLHDFALVPRIADRVVLLDAHGHLVAAGPTEEVLVPAVLEPIYGVGFARVELGAGRWAVLSEDRRPEAGRCLTRGENDL